MWSVISVFVCLFVVYICFCEVTCLTLDQSQNGLGSPRLFASQIPLGAPVQLDEALAAPVLDEAPF